MWLLKMRVLVVPVLVSTGIFLLIGAALPPRIGVPLFYIGIAAAVALACPLVESIAVRLLAGARALTRAERQVLEPVLANLADRGLGSPHVSVYASRRASLPSRAIGRRSVIVDLGLIEAFAYRRITRDEVAAVVGHSATAVQLGLTRHDVVATYWTTPWRLLSVVHSPRRGPLALAWRLRGVVAVIASARTLHDEVSPRSVTAATLILLLAALTYLVPRWQDQWARAAADAADRVLKDRELGPGLATFLRRCPPSTELATRIHALEQIERPQLRLVQGG